MVRDRFNHRFFEFFYSFIAYAFIGWCMETIYMSARAGQFVNRGFLFGPFCPIYGFGALLLIVFLEDGRKKGIAYFFHALVITTVLELIVGIILRIAFNTNWWDYSAEPFNLLGLICIKSSITWGMLSMLFMNYIHPAVRKFMARIPANLRKSISYIFALYFLIDCVSTVTLLTEPNTQVNQLLQLTP